MVLDCLSCHRPVVAPNGTLNAEPRYEVLATCGTCGASYIVRVDQMKPPVIPSEEIDRRRNRTT